MVQFQKPGTVIFRYNTLQLSILQSILTRWCGAPKHSPVFLSVSLLIVYLPLGYIRNTKINVKKKIWPQYAIYTTLFFF